MERNFLKQNVEGLLNLTVNELSAHLRVREQFILSLLVQRRIFKKSNETLTLEEFNTMSDYFQSRLKSIETSIKQDKFLMQPRIKKSSKVGGNKKLKSYALIAVHGLGKVILIKKK